MSGHFFAFRDRLKLNESKKNRRRNKTAKRKHVILNSDTYGETEGLKKSNLSKEEIDKVVQDVKMKMKNERHYLLIKRILVALIIVLSILILKKIFI